jgi:sulfhydrogenase subunit beta (sulfur reductase)
MDDAIRPGSMWLPAATALDRLFTSLHDAGFTIVGPTVRDGAIVLDELEAASDLPFGWGVQLEPGGYRIRRRSDGAAFGHSAGPQSWKRFLHPPREKLWSASLADGGFDAEADDDPAPPRLAFFGVRPCDLRAIDRPPSRVMIAFPALRSARPRSTASW